LVAGLGAFGLAAIDALLLEPVVDRGVDIRNVAANCLTFVPARASSITWRRTSGG
jgi:hypothetical protein